MDDHLASVLDGDRNAYAHVVRRYQRDVWAIASVLLDSRDATEQFVADIFIEAYQQLDRYDPKYDFGAFVKTIARQMVRERLALAAERGAPLAIYREHLAKVFADDATAARQQRRLHDVVGRCLGTLSQQKQTVIQGRYDRGLDYREISEETRRPVASLRQLLNRTRVGLTKAIRTSGGNGA